MTSYGEKLPALTSRRQNIDKFESDLFTFTAIVGTVFIVGMSIIGWQRGKLFGLIVSVFFGGAAVLFLLTLIEQYSRRQLMKNWQNYQQAWEESSPFIIKKVEGDTMVDGYEVVDDAPTFAEAINKAQQLHNSTGETYEIEHHQDQQVDAYTQDGKLFETWVDNKLVKQYA